MSLLPVNTVRVECVYRITSGNCQLVAGFNVWAELVVDDVCTARYRYYNPEYPEREYAFTDCNIANELAGAVGHVGFVTEDRWGGWR